MYKVSPYNFAGIPFEDFERYQTSKAVVIPFPYDSTTSWRPGTREGPAAIIRASRNMELYDVELGMEIYQAMGIHTLSEIVPSFKSPEENVSIVATVVRSLLKDGKFPALVGGEHSLTVGAVNALKEKHRDLSVLYLDAHADLREEYEGTKYSHCSVALRIVELGCPIFMVGVRSMSGPEHQYLKDSQLSMASPREIAQGLVTTDDILERLTDRVYVSIDLDVFDPSEMPSVGTPEPGGLHWHQVLDVLRQVATKKEVVGFDTVELCPNPLNVAPDFLAASIIYKFLGYIFCKT